MYAIKIMSSANMADSDVGKGFKMIMVEAGDTFEFGHDPDTGKPQVTVTGFRAGDPTLVTYPVTGNCYVLSETGKTIASFWGRSLWDTPIQDTAPETEVISGTDESSRKVAKITIDPNDSHRERTIDAIQSVFTNYAKNAFPADDNCAVMRKQWEDRGLTNIQVMMLQERRLALKACQLDRDKAFRARVGYLMSNGIPSDIAMSNALYMLGAKETGVPEV